MSLVPCAAAPQHIDLHTLKANLTAKYFNPNTDFEKYKHNIGYKHTQKILSQESMSNATVSRFSTKFPPANRRCWLHGSKTGLGH